MTRKSTPMTAMTTTSSGTLNPEFFTDLLAPRRGAQLIPASRAQSDPLRSPGEKHDQCHGEPTARSGSRSKNKRIAIKRLGTYGLAARSSGRRLVGGSGGANRYFLQRGVLIRLQIVVLAAAAKRLVNYTLRQFPLCSKA